MGKVFQMAPCIMRCKPTQHDRWERRIIELAAYLFRHGHANVPEVSRPLLHLVGCCKNLSSSLSVSRTVVLRDTNVTAP